MPETMQNTKKERERETPAKGKQPVSHRCCVQLRAPETLQILKPSHELASSMLG